MFVSRSRVVRDGYLIAFEGEEMTEAEAASRGLIGCDSESPKKLTKAELIAEAEASGIEVPSNATKAEIEKLLAAAAGGE
ncbi:MAG: hypothetical protein SOW20_04550 [Berryella intestinalis]|uniref:hypothetical protein n=1 Tax=Berryella intestinalis TaxID=1531429 RepID=UPI002A50C73A|nr:hypothetical protein [Berryella intestinalis]MDD7369717.1 hypothetical protein [Berryella intestinalis]MDY3129282.1 hypothetical protein [Berryella intestinalis]